MHNWKRRRIDDEWKKKLSTLKIEQRTMCNFDDCMYKKTIHLNQPIHLFLTRGANIGKTFTLLLLIQGFLRHYNIKLGFDPLKQKAILMVYTCKTTFNIDGTTIYSVLSLPLNCKHLQSLSIEKFDSLLKTYDEL
jgi:hypothetical protein